MALSSEQRFQYWLAAGTILRGWVLAEQGQGEEGVEEMRQGLAARRAIGTEMSRPRDLARLAEAYGKTGQIEESLGVLAEALETMHKTGERFYEAELDRLKGELLLRMGAGEQGRKSPTHPLTHSPFLHPRHVFTRLSTLPAASRRNRWSCGRR